MTADDTKNDGVYRRILDEKGLDGLLDERKEGRLLEEKKTPEGGDVPKDSARTAFPLTSIYCCTLDEYYKHFKRPSAYCYKAINLAYTGRFPSDGEYLLMKFAERVPSGTDVVVNFRSSVVLSDGNIIYQASGIAIIPKKDADNL